MKIQTKAIISSALFALVSTSAHATLTSVYDFMLDAESNGYQAQTGNETWTFHNGDETGSLMGRYTGTPGGNPVSGYGITNAYAQFSAPGGAGSIPGSIGTSDKEGIFTHTVSSGYSSAVLHLDAASLIGKVLIDYELVGNGNQGNGIDFFLRVIKAGLGSDYATTTMSSGVSNTAVYDFGPSGLSLASGDQIAVIFSARGSYLYDHGWWNISFEESARQTNDVPDSASSGALALIAALGLAMARRKFSR